MNFGVESTKLEFHDSIAGLRIAKPKINRKQLQTKADYICVNFRINRERVKE